MSVQTPTPLDDIKTRIAGCRTYNFGMQYADQLAHEDAPKMTAALDAVEATVASLEAQANDLYTKADKMTEPMYMHRARSRADAYVRIAGDLRRNINDALA